MMALEYDETLEYIEQRVCSYVGTLFSEESNILH